MLTFLSACLAARPQPVTVQVWVRWPGASPAEVEDALTEPVEASLSLLPGASALIGESWSEMSRVTVTLPAASATGVAAALDRVSLPADAEHPWAETVPGESSAWIVPDTDARDNVQDLMADFGLGGAWSDVVSRPVVEVVFPADGEADVEELRQLAEPDRFATVEALLGLPVSSGRTVREMATVRTAAPRTWARWNGVPVQVWHVARPAAEVARWWKDRPTDAVPVPAGDALSVEIWGEGADAGPVEAALRAAGAAEVLTVFGRPFPGGGPEPGRLEVLAWWDGPIPDPSSVAVDRGDVELLTDVVTVVRGPAERLAELGPPPRTTWDVEVDPDRAARFGVSTERVTTAIRDATVGTRFVAVDGTAIEVRVGEADSVEAIAGIVVGLREGAPVLLRDVATVRTVPTERYRFRYDRASAAIVRGSVPADLEVVAKVPRSRW